MYRVAAGRRGALWYAAHSAAALSVLALVTAGLTGCGPSAAPDQQSPLQEHPAPNGGEPAPAPFTQLAVLGDSIATGRGVHARHSFHSLLLSNDEEAFPDFSGRDLQTRDARVVRVVTALEGAPALLLPAQAAVVPPNPTGRSLVLIATGINDFRGDFGALIDIEKVRAQARRVAGHLRPVVAHFANEQHYPHGYRLGLIAWIDPTDGVGRIPLLPSALDTWACAALTFIQPEHAPLLARSWRAYNSTLRETGPWDEQAVLIDAYTPFLGHGFHHADPQSPHYRASDPTRWFIDDCFHPNERGHHELRSMIWQALVEPGAT